MISALSRPVPLRIKSVTSFWHCYVNDQIQGKRWEIHGELKRHCYASTISSICVIAEAPQCTRLTQTALSPCPSTWLVSNHQSDFGAQVSNEPQSIMRVQGRESCHRGPRTGQDEWNKVENDPKPNSRLPKMLWWTFGSILALAIKWA